MFRRSECTALRKEIRISRLYRGKLDGSRRKANSTYRQEPIVLFSPRNFNYHVLIGIHLRILIVPAFSFFYFVARRQHALEKVGKPQRESSMRRVDFSAGKSEQAQAI